MLVRLPLLTRTAAVSSRNSSSSTTAKQDLPATDSDAGTAASPRALDSSSVESAPMDSVPSCPLSPPVSPGPEDVMSDGAVSDSDRASVSSPILPNLPPTLSLRSIAPPDPNLYIEKSVTDQHFASLAGFCESHGGKNALYIVRLCYAAALNLPI